MSDESPEPPKLHPVSLTTEQLDFLLWGLRVWDGLAYPSTAFMQFLGFSDGASLVDRAFDLSDKLQNNDELSASEWTLVLSLAETGFASDVQGAGLEWQGTSGIPDRDAIELLRSIQQKLIHIRSRYQRYSGAPR